MRRFLVLFTSALLGLIACVLYIYLVMPPRPPEWRGRKGLTDLEQQITTEATILFFSVAYTTGLFLYRRLNSDAEYDTLLARSTGHLFVLHTLGGLCILSYQWAALKRGDVSGSALLGAAMVVLASVNLIRLIRQAK